MALRGLTVGTDGTLRLDGQRFRNIGMNYGGAIQPIYGQPTTNTCVYTPSAEQDAVLDACVAMKVKVLRVKATPFWPKQWVYGVNGGVAWGSSTAADREAHYLKIDVFLAKCAARGIGVILNLFFRYASVPDMVGNNIRQWLVGGSNTRTYATALTQEMVTRYLANEAVYGWEFSNEMNHYLDVIEANRDSPTTSTNHGTPASYSEANDCFKGLELQTLFAWWYGVVRAIDAQRIVLTGNGPNSYNQPNGTKGITTPMRPWHLEQVRDNPTNCGTIHWYGNVGYSSSNFRGLNAVLTGVRHWQQANGRGFVLGEFGNQPWRMDSITGNGTTATFNIDTSCPVEVGDKFAVALTTTFDGAYTVASVNAARDTLTAACGIAGTWTASGTVKGLHFISGERLTRMCDDIINSGTDVAMLWQIDGATAPYAAPAWESILYPGNEAQQAATLAANTRLGW